MLIANTHADAIAVVAKKRNVTAGYHVGDVFVSAKIASSRSVRQDSLYDQLVHGYVGICHAGMTLAILYIS